MEYQLAVFSLLQTPVASDGSFSSTGINKTADRKEPLQEAISTALVRLETIARLYYLRHSYESCDTFLAFFLSNLGLSALEGLKFSTSDDERFKHLRSTIVLCVKGLYDQGQYVHVASAVYRLLRGRLSPQELKLVQRYVHWNLTDDDEPLITEHIQSQWSLSIVGQEKDPEAVTLENLVQRYNQMSVKSSKEMSQEDEPSISEAAKE